MPENLTWECVFCRKPVEDEMGTLNIDLVEVQQYQSDIDRYRSEHGSSTTFGQFLRVPSRTRWRVHHDACYSPNDQHYFIAIESVRTAPKLLSWTAHLWAKDWFPSTRWDLVVRQVLPSTDD